MIKHFGSFRLFSLSFFILEGALAVAVFLLCYFFGNVRVDKDITIPQGSKLNNIATLLGDNGVVRSPMGFQLLAYGTMRQNKLKTGDYRFTGRVSAYQVLRNIYLGKTIEEILQILEGWTVQQIMVEMDRAPYLVGRVVNMPQEGTLLPNSYFYRRYTNRQDLVDKMARAMTEKLDKTWLTRSANLAPYITTPQEFIILASMVERETGIKAEKARIAGVFLNRLQKNMKLESDPTVIYGLSNGLGQLPRKLLIKDLKKDSPWNTYTRHGLPRTAISNPSAQTLESVAHPEKNGYYYFVANGKGGHSFSVNFDEHQKNIQQYIYKKF